MTSNKTFDLFCTPKSDYKSLSSQVLPVTSVLQSAYKYVKYISPEKC